VLPKRRACFSLIGPLGAHRLPTRQRAVGAGGGMGCALSGEKISTKIRRLGQMDCCF
jgi:hypothetical protein